MTIKIQDVVSYDAHIARLGCALWFALKKPAPVIIQPSRPFTNSVPAAAVVSDGLTRNGLGEIVERVPLSWAYAGDFVRIWLGGYLLEKGLVTARGVVESFSISCVKFRDFDGKVRWVYHAPAESKAVVSAKGKDGKSS